MRNHVTENKPQGRATHDRQRERDGQGGDEAFGVGSHYPRQGRDVGRQVAVAGHRDEQRHAQSR